jgi:hypothetical protein
MDLLLAVMMLMLVMGTCASTGWDIVEFRNREVWWWTGIMMLEVVLMENKYAAALLAVNILGLWQIGKSWYVLRGFLIPMAGVAGIYALVSPHMQRWMVPWLLWTGAAIGIFLGTWAVIGLLISKRPFRLMAPLPPWFGMWGIYEDLDGRRRHLCGQANAVHLASLSAFACACCAGLLWLGQWWAGLALVLCYLPQHAIWLKEGKGYHPHVGHLAMLAVCLAGLALWSLTTAGAVLTGCVTLVAVLTMRAKPWANRDTSWSWWDSGRLTYWWDVLRLGFWKSPLRQKLFGTGTCTWFFVTFSIGEHPALKHKHVYTAAHNEYLQQLIEHGLVGLAVMLAYIGEAFWRNLHGAPEQQAGLFLGLAWCAVAFVHFPAVWYHEYHSKTQKEEHWYGSPPLNLWTMMIALLMEVR